MVETGSAGNGVRPVATPGQLDCKLWIVIPKKSPEIAAEGFGGMRVLRRGLSL
jgi:hypothetical protein